METTSTATTDTRHPVAESGRALARRTALGVLVAVLTVLVLRGIVTALGPELGGAGPQNPFATAPILASSVVAGIGAAVAYAALVRFSARPVRNFLALAGLVFAVMMVPVLAFAPALGVTPVGQAVLVVFHVAVAVPVVACVVGAIRLG